MWRKGGWAEGRTGVAALALVALAVFPRIAAACEHAQQPSAPPPVRSSATPDTANTLPAPGAVHQRERTTERDDAALVQALEHRIKCTCGCGLDVFTCRTTDFTCTTSPAMHRVVLARLDSGLTADQVVARFEAQYGASILMQPPKQGFNLTAYWMPFAALALGIAVLVAFMKRWTRKKDGRDGQDGRDGRTAPTVQADDMARLERELERFEA